MDEHTYKSSVRMYSRTSFCLPWTFQHWHTPKQSRLPLFYPMKRDFIYAWSAFALHRSCRPWIHLHNKTDTAPTCVWTVRQILVCAPIPARHWWISPSIPQVCGHSPGRSPDGILTIIRQSPKACPTPWCHSSHSNSKLSSNLRWRRHSTPPIITITTPAAVIAVATT